MKRLFISMFIVSCLFGTASLWSDEMASPFGADEVKVEKATEEKVTITTTEKDSGEKAAKETKKEEEKLKAKVAKEVEKKAGVDSKDFPMYGTVDVGNSTLNVRLGAWKTVVDSLRTGDKVKLVGKQGEWYKAEIGGTTKFIHMNFVNSAYRSAGKTPVVYPWGNAVKGVDVVISKKGSDKSGWGGVYPCTPPAKYISSPYGYRTHPVTGAKLTFHKGVDLPCPNGTRLNSLASGVVTAVGYDNGGGNYIRIRYDNGYESFYCHLQKSLVRKGDKVGAGEKVALADNTGIYTTGAHLHFEVWYGGKTIDPKKSGVPLIK